MEEQNVDAMRFFDKCILFMGDSQIGPPIFYQSFGSDNNFLFKIIIYDVYRMRFINDRSHSLVVLWNRNTP